MPMLRLTFPIRTISTARFAMTRPAHTPKRLQRLGYLMRVSISHWSLRRGNRGVPTIDNCIDCHAKAGGGDNVKHGDLSMSLVNTTLVDAT